MTTPDERIRALKDINEFIWKLVDMKTTAGREELIRRLMRHYPTDAEIDVFIVWKSR